MAARKAAHFLSDSVLANSPPNDAIVRALLEHGFDVELFAPGKPFDTTGYGPRVAALPVVYSRRWIGLNAFSRRWRQYAVFSGTSESPMAVAGVLSFVHRRPSFALADEIFSGAYRGDAPENWKRLCRWGMRRASFNIVNDTSRVELQRAYAGIAERGRIIVYPGSFKEPPEPGDRSLLRRQWGLPEGALVIGVSGGFNETAGAEWLVKAFRDRKELYGAMQPWGMNAMSRMLLEYIPGRERIYIEKRFLPWREAWASAVAADIGLAIYTNPVPQFQNMGTSSNRLCMFLSMGVPVIANRQPSFAFLERYECGVLVDSYQEFSDAIEHIKQNLDQMKANALRCAREHIDSEGRYAALREELRRILA